MHSNWFPVGGQSRNMEPTPFFSIDAGRFKYFRTTIDLLGIRQLTQSAQTMLVLRLLSFWKAPLDIEIGDDGEPPSINLKGKVPGEKEWKALANHVKSFMTLVPSLDSVEAFGSRRSSHSSQAGTDDDLVSSVGTDVGLDEFVGTRIITPIYKTPIIPYLQYAYAGTMTDPVTKIKVPRAPWYVLLPDVNFQIRSNIGLGEYGSASVDLQKYLGPEDQDGKQTLHKGSWFEQIPDKLAKVPKEFVGLAPMKHCQLMPRSYSISIDIFATRAGNLLFEPDTRMGRNLLNQRLFSVDGLCHYLNPADYYLNNPTLTDNEFGKQPLLYVDRTNTTPYPHGIPDHPNDPPFRASVLKPFMEYVRHHSVQIMPHMAHHSKWEKELHKFRKEMDDPKSHLCQGKWTTSRLARLMRAYGWRCASRSHYPIHDKVVKGGEITHIVHFPKGKDKNGNGNGQDSSDSSSSDSDMEAQRNQEVAVTIKPVGPPRELEPHLDPHEAYRNRKEMHQRTYMRKVGHIIEEKRKDSKLLARMRMVCWHDEEPVSEENPNYVWQYPSNYKDYQAKVLADHPKLRECIQMEEKTHHEQLYPEVLNNFFILKYCLKNDAGSLQRSQVIWAVPEDRYHFTKAGETLFVIRILEGEFEGNHISVLTPGADLRFPFENAYFVRKSLRERWKTLLAAIGDTSSKDARAAAAQGHSTGHNNSPSDPTKQQEDLRKAKKRTRQIEKAKHHTDPNGFSAAIPVVENDFVMRLRKRDGTNMFDRAQCESWYQSYLGETFADVRDRVTRISQSSLDPTGVVDPFKIHFQKKQMNLRTDFLHGESMTRVGELKGHVTVDEVKEEDVDKSHRSVFEDIVSPQYVPLNRFWQNDTLFAHVYVLTARNLMDIGGGSSSISPYITIQSGNQKLESKIVHPTSPNPDFYEYFCVPVSVPGTDRLTIRLMNKGLVSTPSIIGEVNVDIEDRWLALIQKKLTDVTNVDWMKKYLSTPETDELGKVWKSNLGPPHPFPVEFENLMYIDYESNISTMAGNIRYWVDLAPAEENYTSYDVNAVTVREQMEIRLTIWDVTSITIFKDAGERNDLMVRVIFLAKNIDGTITKQSEDTDTHNWVLLWSLNPQILFL